MSTWRVDHGDCLDLLRAMPDASVDAVVTDPPYCAGAVSESQRTSAGGQGLRSENIKRFGWFVGDNMGTAGLAWLLRSIACEAARVCKPSGSLVVFCDWRMMATLQPAIESAGMRFQNLVVWDKGNMGLGSGFRAQHELALHFTNGKPEYHDRSTGNVICTRRVSAVDREHQTQKPVELMAKLIRVVCPQGGTVVDPFCGSGSTGVACAENDRNFIGFERDSGYVEIARRRIAEAANVLGGPVCVA
jgi:site-specific DNA-methyltransferase (adenine-specific)